MLFRFAWNIYRCIEKIFLVYVISILSQIFKFVFASTKRCEIIFNKYFLFCVVHNINKLMPDVWLLLIFAGKVLDASR